MTLKSWLKRNRRTQRWLAEALSVDQSAVSYWVTGSRLPYYDNRIAIERITAGEVKAGGWRRRGPGARAAVLERAYGEPKSVRGK